MLLADSPAEFVVAGSGENPARSALVELAGTPVRIGISWRYDDAEPNCVTISRVVNGSAASQAGLLLNDRVLEVAGQRFSSSEDFQTLVLAADGQAPPRGTSADADEAAPDGAGLTLLIERDGFVREVRIAVPSPLRSVPANDESMPAVESERP